MIEQGQKCERNVKLFTFIPIYSWTIRGMKKKWKIFGLPLLKRTTSQDGCETKYYFCGVLLMKVVKKYK